MHNEDKVNILLVDDQPARLLSYEALLFELGANLVRANSGPEALQRLMEREYALILLDVNMPGMDGFETASLVHQHPRFEKTPIIFITGIHVTDLDRLKGYKLGAVDYVYIPVVPEILRSKVSVLIELFSKRKELQRVNESLQRANAELANANSTLQAEKTAELERLNVTLESANQRLAETNATLEAEITERQRIEEALKEADRRKDEFLAMLAHELRNPLAPVRNAVEIMLRSRMEDPQLLWSRDVIQRQVVHLTRLVNDLLDISRITRGKIELHKEPIDVSGIIANAIETSRPAIEQRRHELTISQPDEPVRLHGDLIRLAQVVSNLLNNAAKYTEECGRIWLTVEMLEIKDGGSPRIAIRVRDNGVGIPTHMLGKVFDLFTQADHTRARAQGGLGIGLALVKRLVEMHGGDVVALSDGEGKGSEFVVTLPALPKGQTSSFPKPQTLRTPAPATALRILVVDDNYDAATSLALLLHLAGNDVHFAHDGLEALESSDKLRPDVVLLDLGMPRMDGYEAARRIRAEPWGKKMVLIAVTGLSQEVDRNRTRDVGIDAHVIKPVEISALTELLAQMTRDRGVKKDRAAVSDQYGVR